MGALLGSLSALCIGLGDLFGRRVVAARGVVAAVAGLQGVAVLAALATVLVIGGQFIITDIVLGALSGLGFGVGLSSYYGGLARSSSTVVSPLAATFSALVPFGYTAGTQGIPAFVTLVGVVVAIGGLVLLTAGGRNSTNVRSGILWGLLSGMSYGIGQTLIIDISADSGAWPAVSQRLVAFALLAAMAGRAGICPVPPRGLRIGTAAAGVFAALSTVLLLAAVQFDATSAVVTASMFPAATVTIGYLYFGDPVSRAQILGLVVVLGGVAMVVVG